MKIIHICLYGILMDGYTYQDNLLTKYHRKMGLDVTAITLKGENSDYAKGDYYNKDNVHIIRLDRKVIKLFGYKFVYYPSLIDVIEKEKPDILFIHNVQFLQLLELSNYLKRNPQITTYVDNHSDFSNSGRNFFSKYFLHKGIWRFCAHAINPFVKKFYGVTPARVDWLIEMYKLPREKCELLLMGADDEEVERIRANNIRKKTREKYGIKETDFLIVTGGKIDLSKQQTLFLMEAIKKINKNSIKLMVFGSVDEKFKDEFMDLCDGEQIQYLGWATASQSYDYFAAADIACFPGRHSVYWEQVAGMGIPLICKYWDGTTHVDIGGNAAFLYEDSVEEIKTKIEYLANNNEAYNKMLQIAQEGKNQFSYYKIAKKSIDM